jgi:hypothetical protein
MVRKYPPQRLLIAVVTLTAIIAYWPYLLFLLLLTGYSFFMSLWDAKISAGMFDDKSFLDALEAVLFIVIVPLMGILGTIGGLSAYINYEVIKSEFSLKSKVTLLLIGCGTMACFMCIVAAVINNGYFSFRFEGNVFLSFFSLFPVFLFAYGLYGMVCIFRVKFK